MQHQIPPVYDENSEVLVLGSFPSVKSREVMLFYGHPQNRFWRVLASVFGSDVPCTVEEKKLFLKDKKIALWDVIASCDVTGSADNSIKNVIPNDLTDIFSCAKIKKIFVNGKTAQKYYNKYLREKTGAEAILLPSTSPANASVSFEKLCIEWTVVKNTVEV